MTSVAGWSVVIPLKPLNLAKSRLDSLPTPLRRALVIAMACDVRDAVLACRSAKEIVIVTGDPRWHSILGTPRLRFVADSPGDTLNDAIRRGAAACRTGRPLYGVAALTADLPALQPAELSQALDHTAGTSALFVPDAHGEGTTLFAARSHEHFWPQYGDCSRSRHIQAGAQEILRPQRSGIRQDVDTIKDLERAQALGLGHHTRALVATIMGTRCFLPSRR